MVKINFIIAAFNEEDRIVRTIGSIKEIADQIVLLDPGSTDATIVNAMQSYPVRVCPVPKDMFNILDRVNPALEIIKKHSKSEWVIFLNCSETIPHALGKKLLYLINKNDALCGVLFYRQSYTFGVKTHKQKINYITRSIFKTKNNYRLFKYSAWDRKKSRMHAEFPIFKECIKNTVWLFPLERLSFKQYRFGDLNVFDKKHSVYSYNEAEQKYLNGERTNLFKMLFKPLLTFIYFLPSIFSSRRSFIVSMYHVFYKFQVEAKLYLMSQSTRSNRLD